MARTFEAEGTLSLHPRGFGFLALDGEPLSAWVAPPEMNPFLAGDRARAAVTIADDGRASATRLVLVARPRHELFGAVGTRDGKRVLRVDRLTANTDWALAGADGVPEGALVVARAAGAGEARLVRRVVDADASLERVVVRHGLTAEYPDAALREAKGARLPGLGARRDLRDLTTITIDAPVSRDLDDALAVLPAAPDGGLRVLVSIADVDALVAEGSALDVEARRRGTSVYLAGRVLPMLPPALSEDALSLLPGKDRPALTVELRLDPEGTVTSTDVYESLIRSHARLSYEEVAAFLDRGEEGTLARPVAEALRWLRAAGARLSAARRGRGGVTLLREEAYVTLDAVTGEPLRLDARRDSSANALVERLMVAANEAVAQWLVARGLPGVFRVHDAPDAERVAELATSARNAGFEAGFGAALTPRALAAFEAQWEGTSAAPAMGTVLGRALGPARYTVLPSPHFGLGAPLYLHFTSPIRRYSDLAVHRVVKQYLAGRRDRRAGEPALEELAAHLNGTERAASKAETERLRMLAARLFAGRVGERMRGTVVAAKPFGLVVQLAGTGVQGTLATEALGGAAYEVGASLEVEIAGANEELGRIELVPAP